MTLNEFVEQKSVVVKTIFSRIKSRVQKRDTIDDLKDYTENECLLYDDYFFLMGYMCAARDCGDITYDDYFLLENELDLIIGM